jgi:hypothetical protein
MNKGNSIIIREAYKEYEPPFDVAATVNRLLNGVPKKHIIGIKTVVLSSSLNLNKKVKNTKVHVRGKAYKIGECRGQYTAKWKAQPAWIEVWVDNTLRQWPKGFFHFSIFRDIAISEILFHEIGHHIHKTQAPEYKEKEDVADSWMRKLNRYYYRRQYWYLAPMLLVIRFVLKPIAALIKKRKN